MIGFDVLRGLGESAADSEHGVVSEHHGDGSNQADGESPQVISETNQGKKLWMHIRYVKCSRNCLKQPLFGVKYTVTPLSGSVPKI